MYKGTTYSFHSRVLVLATPPFSLRMELEKKNVHNPEINSGFTKSGFEATVEGAYIGMTRCHVRGDVDPSSY